MDVVYLILMIVIIFFDRKKVKFGFSKQSVLAIKGFGTLLILFHHLSQRNYGHIFNNFGYLGVSLFFFVSGYGLYQSYINQNDYWKKIIFKKIPKLLQYMSVTVVISIVVFTLLGYPVSLKEVLISVSGNRLLNWYFLALIIKYIIFVISIIASKGNDKLVLFYTIIFIFLYIVVLKAMGADTFWYQSSISFVYGIYISMFIDNSRVMEHRSTILKFNAIFFVLFFIIINYTTVFISISFLQIVITYLLNIIICNIAFVYFSSYTSVSILNNIGEKSAEIILMQEIALFTFRNKHIYLYNDFIWVICSVLLLVFLAFILNKIIEKIN
ncbi:MAG: hypothetical protein RR404_01175 [Bacilli bacterium]